MPDWAFVTQGETRNPVPTECGPPHRSVEANENESIKGKP